MQQACEQEPCVEPDTERCIEFTVPMAARGKSRARTGKGFAYTPKEQVHWEQQFALYASMYQPKHVIEGPVAIAATFAMPRPKRLLRKKDPEGCVPMSTKPDLDNMAKSVLDALKTWWRDDAQVASMLLKKVFCEKSGTPRIHICLIYEVTCE